MLNKKHSVTRKCSWTHTRPSSKKLSPRHSTRTIPRKLKLHPARTEPSSTTSHRCKRDGNAHSATTASKIGITAQTNAHILLACKDEIYNKVHDTQPCLEHTLKWLGGYRTWKAHTESRVARQVEITTANLDEAQRAEWRHGDELNGDSAPNQQDGTTCKIEREIISIEQRHATI